MAHHRPIDKEFEDADDTGVLVLSSRNLRNFPVVPGELCDFNDLLEAGRTTVGCVDSIYSHSIHGLIHELMNRYVVHLHVSTCTYKPRRHRQSSAT